MKLQAQLPRPNACMKLNLISSRFISTQIDYQNNILLFTDNALKSKNLSMLSSVNLFHAKHPKI